jgi:hypothetical protein
MSLLNQQTNTNAIPNHDIFYTKFKLNGSSALNINGTTPKVFRLEDLTITIQDNLSSLNFFEVSASGVKL